MIYGNSIFGGKEAILEGVKLKNPNQFKEAVLFESLNDLPESKLKEFVGSPEAKAMVDCGALSADALDRLGCKKMKGAINTAICQLAKEHNDPLWDELIAYRAQERRVMNDLIEKYGENGKKIAEEAMEGFKGMIPERFRA